MNYIPFETTKDYIKNFLNPSDKEEFSHLKTLVNNLDEEGVQDWFNKQNERLKTQGKENLAKAIGNYTYYFAIQSHRIMKLDEIEEIENKKYQILLKHFKIEDQLKILTQQFEIKDEKIFSLLYQTAKNQKKENIFYSSRIILDSLVKLFHKEEFDTIKKIEFCIEKNMINLENPYMAFCMDGGVSYYKLKNNYSITDEIILNYSDAKKDFILSYNEELPLKNKAYQLLEDIQNNYKERDWLSADDNKKVKDIIQNVDTYIKAVLYFELDKKLTSKSVKNLLKKI